MLRERFWRLSERSAWALVRWWGDPDEGFSERVGRRFYHWALDAQERRGHLEAERFYRETGRCWCQSEIHPIQTGHSPTCTWDPDEIPF